MFFFYRHSSKQIECSFKFNVAVKAIRFESVQTQENDNDYENIIYITTKSSQSHISYV